MNPTAEQSSILTADLKLGGTYFGPPYQMFSAQADAASRRYRIYLGKNNYIWLVACEEACGDHIYCSGGPSSQGFGGATLEFTLENGCDSIKLKGPWHANADSMFADTGVDFRNRNLTYGAIGKRWGKHKDWTVSVIEDLVYFDAKPIVGSYDRIRKLAEEMSNQLGIVLYYSFQSQSGGSSGPVNWDKYGKHDV